MNFGIICLVCGKERHGWGQHVDELQRCLKTLREHHPDVPVTIWTDSPDQPWPAPYDVRDVWDIIPMNARARHGQQLGNIHGWKVAIGFKLMAMLESPYDQTLWLDGDVSVLRPIDSIFDADFDIAMACDYNNKGMVTNLYNSGVVALRDSLDVRRFLKATWHDWFKTNTRSTEQDIMYKLLKGKYTRLNFHLLDCYVWNVRPALANAMPQEQRVSTRILHSRGHRLLDPPKHWEQYR